MATGGPGRGGGALGGQGGGQGGDEKVPLQTSRATLCQKELISGGSSCNEGIRRVLQKILWDQCLF